MVKNKQTSKKNPPNFFIEKKKMMMILSTGYNPYKTASKKTKGAGPGGNTT